MRCLMRRERRGEGMVVVKKTFQIEKHHENRKMTCHESRETADLHSWGGRSKRLGKFIGS